MKQEARITSLLIYGITPDRCNVWTEQNRAVLNTWHVTTTPVLDGAEAVRHILGNSSLELVYFSTDNKAPPEQILKDATLIADALYNHPYKPWVYLSPHFAHLQQTFRQRQIQMEDGMLQMVLFRRWVEQKNAA